MKHPKVMNGDQDIKTEEPRVNRGQVVRMVQGKDADNDDVYSEDLVQSVENEAGVISDQIVMSNGLKADLIVTRVCTMEGAIVTGMYLQHDEAETNSDQTVMSKGFEAELTGDKKIYDGWGKNETNVQSTENEASEKSDQIEMSKWFEAEPNCLQVGWGNSGKNVEDDVLSKGFEAELNSDKGLHD